MTTELLFNPFDYVPVADDGQPVKPTERVCGLCGATSCHNFRWEYTFFSLMGGDENFRGPIPGKMESLSLNLAELDLLEGRERVQALPGIEIAWSPIPKLGGEAMVAAFDGERCVGTYYISKSGPDTAPKFIAYVDPEYRGRGIYFALYSLVYALDTPSCGDQWWAKSVPRHAVVVPGEVQLYLWAIAEAQGRGWDVPAVVLETMDQQTKAHLDAAERVGYKSDFEKIAEAAGLQGEQLEEYLQHWRNGQQRLHLHESESLEYAELYAELQNTAPHLKMRVPVTVGTPQVTAEPTPASPPANVTPISDAVVLPSS